MAVCVKDPLVPVIVNVYDPGGVVEAVVTESVEVEVAGLTVKVPVAEVGSPLTLKVTGPLNPLLGVIVTP